MPPHLFTPAPEPKTPLGKYRVLSKNAGVRVSPLQLGAMSIGNAWEDFMGSMDKKQSFALLDAFYDAGGNFIDTANNYQDEESEEWIGEWMAERGIRDQIVLATKFTTNYKGGPGKAEKGQQSLPYTGNNKRSLHLSVRDSLKKLQTDWIDILYLHWWDWTTDISEIMDSLHILVQQGKVLYLGISDTPAWVVSAANTYALAHGKTPFSIYQGRWNIMLRDFEHEIIPMARHFGMALAPWDVLGGGKFKTKAQIEERRKADGKATRSIMGSAEQTSDEEKISAALEEVAKEHGVTSPTTIALAYVLSKTPRVFPIIGGRKTEHLHDNIKALDIKLSDAQIEKLEGVLPHKPTFPMNFIGEDPHITGQMAPLSASVAQMSFVKGEKPIGHE